MNRPHYSQSSAVEATSRAAKHLIQHLSECKNLFGIRTDKEATIKPIETPESRSGHRVALKAPFKGFSDACRERIENYGQAVAVWHNVNFSIDWSEKTVEVSFLLPEHVEWREKPKFIHRVKRWCADLFQPRTLKTLRALGQLFVENGFRVHEPFCAKLVMLKGEFVGYALMLRYPFELENDRAGVALTYDMMIPLLADAVALERRLKAEIQKSEGTTIIFFTKSRRYKPSLYGLKPAFRLVSSRAKVWSPKHLAFLQGSTYRACKKLFGEYKKDFTTTKRPVPALGKKGHTVPLHYKPGAGGRVVDDSYVLTVGRMTEKISHRYGLQASVVHQNDDKVILVTFYTGRDSDWQSGARYFS